MEFLALIFNPLAALFIYCDATRHGIGQIGKASFFNIPAGAWAVEAYFLGIMTVPLYLLKRRELITKAQTYPVYVDPRSRKRVILCIMIIFVIPFIPLLRQF